MSMWTFLKKHMEENPDSVLACEEETLSYTQVIKKVETAAAALKKISPNKLRCAVYCNREMNAALAVLTGFCADFVPIPLSPCYGEKHNRKILGLTQPDLILTDNPKNPWLQSLGIPLFHPPAAKLTGCLTERRREPEMEEIAMILCTSGTGGEAKGAMLTESGLIANVQDIAEYFEVDSSDRILIARPLYHCAVLTGEFLLALYRGLQIYFYDGSFNPAAVLACAQQLHATVLCGTPTLFRHLSIYKNKRNPELVLRAAAISGECLSVDTAKKIREAFPFVDFYHVYGLTEASPRVSALPPALFDTCPTAVGFPLRSVSVRIADASGRELPGGETGRLWVRGPNTMKGYYRDTKRTAAVLRDGWLDTGDLAYIDLSGMIHLRGRADDMLIKAGMNIYPAEIEAALKESSMIEAAFAYGYPSESGLRIAVKAVLAKKWKTASLRSVVAECARLLPKYQMPDEVYIVQSLPVNASGKMKRNKQFEE